MTRSKISAVFAGLFAFLAAVVLASSSATALVAPTSGPPAGGTSITVEGIHFVAVSTQYNFSLGLTSEGTVYSWGDNNFGQLGDGTLTNSHVPVQVMTPSGPLTGITAISVGAFHGMALSARDVFTWGDNTDGVLGNGAGPRSLFATPVTAMHDAGVTDIAAGASYSLVLIPSVGVYSWGHGPHGQLGAGAIDATLTPYLIPGLTTASEIQAGRYHNLALTPSGLYAWGLNNEGQLGDGTLINRDVPTLVTGALSGVSQLFVGPKSSGAISQGSAYGWGNNDFYQFSGISASPVTAPTLITQVAGVVEMALGANNVTFRNVQGLYTIGGNSEGQLGRTFAGNDYAFRLVEGGLASTTAMSAGNAHVLALSGDGIRSWGRNTEGQLGTGTNVTAFAPVLSANFSPGPVTVGGNAGTAFAVSGNSWSINTPSGTIGTVDVIGSANIFGGTSAGSPATTSWNAGAFTYVAPSSAPSSSPSGSNGSGPSLPGSSSSPATLSDSDAAALARTGNAVIAQLAIGACVLLLAGLLMVPVAHVSRRRR